MKLIQNPPPPDLGPNSDSDAVANLQEALLFLLERERLHLSDNERDDLLRDRAQRVYHGATGRAVIVFREQFGLEAGEIVDGQTAEALNRELVELGALHLIEGMLRQSDGSPADGTLIFAFDPEFIGGAQLGEATTNADGYFRIVYDPTLYTRLGPGVDHTKDTLDLVVFAYDATGATIASSDRFPNPLNTLSVDLVVGELHFTPVPPEPPPPRTEWLIRGQVVDANGPLNDIQVSVFDRDLFFRRGGANTAQQLGSDTTKKVPGLDEDGWFEFAYETTQFAAGDVQTEGDTIPDLVFVLSRDGLPLEKFQIYRLADGAQVAQETLVSDDDLIMGIQARKVEEVRILIPGAEPKPDLTEYERLIQAIEPLLPEQVPPDADNAQREALVGTAAQRFDEDKHRDISFVARETGLDREPIEALAAAFRLAADPFVGAPPAALYAFARIFGAQESRLIAMRRIDELASGLQQTIDSLIIPPLEGDLRRVADAIHTVAIGDALGVRSAGSASMHEILADALPDPEVRAELFSAAVNHTGPDTEFWTRFSAAHPDVPVAPVQYALHLTTLTGGNLPVIQALQQKIPEATSMRALALHLDDAKLEEAIRDSGALPLDVREGEHPEQARARLAGEITGLLEAAQPTAVVARLAKAWQAAAPEAIAAPVPDVLARAILHTDFDLATGKVDTLVAQHGDALFEGMTDPTTRTAAVEGIKRLQRLFQVSTDPKTLGVVASQPSPTGLPFRGAIDIARYGKPAFLARFASAPAELQSSLALMHDRSRALADTVAQLVIGQHQDARDVKPAATSGTMQATGPGPAPLGGPAGGVPGDGVAVPAADVDVIPSWSDFFGGAEICECDDCRSVVGPAAYLVDLFEFLDKRCSADANDVTPLDVLIGHPTKSAAAGQPPGIAGLRPDLAHIKLTCENTNTTIPTVDLINEILESVVAFDQTTPLQTDDDGDPIAPPTIRPNEPSPGVTGPELSAAPEHVVERAYRFVGKAVFPISLPYDRLIAAARAYMRQAGTNRTEVLRLFGTGDTSHAVAAEILGLLARDFEILTGTTLAGMPIGETILPKTLFGFGASEDDAEDETWLTQNANARHLLSALQVSFEELATLLRTRFVGGEVPSADEDRVASQLFLDVDQLKALREAGFAVEPNSDIALALVRGGLSIEDVKAFVEARSDRLATAIVFDPPISCDPDGITLRHLDASRIQADEWLAMHRFVRLAKRMGLSFGELDVALFAVTDAAAHPDFDLSTLGRLAQLKNLKDALDLSWPVAASLVGDMDTHGSSSLYDRLFIANGLARLHPLFRRGPKGEVLDEAAPIGDGIPALTGVFSLDPLRLKELVSLLQVQKLDMPGVSAVHRTVVLARELGLAPKELIKLGKALGEPSLGEAAGRTPESLIRFIERARSLTAAGLDAGKMAYLVGMETGQGDGGGRSANDLGKIIDALPGIMAPLVEQEREQEAQGQRELAEEEDRSNAGNPFAPDAIDSRKRERERRRENGLLRRRAAAQAHLAQAFHLDAAVMALLIEDRTVAGRNRISLLRTVANQPATVLFSRLNEPVPAADRSEAMLLLRAVDRISVLVTATGLDPMSFELVTQEAGLLPAQLLRSLAGKPDPNAVAEALERLARFIELLKQSRHPATLSLAVKALTASEGEDWSAEALSAAGQWLDLSDETVRALPRTIAPELTAAVARRHPVEALAALRTRLALSRRLGLDPSQVADVIAEPIAPKALANLADGVRSHYDAATWLDVSRQLSDPIREASRDALVAFLVKRDGLKDADQLFSRYLIDTQTNAFVLTSRIRQAIFAVQIYVQRILMGLVRKGRGRNAVAPGQINLDEWKTIARLPVWAARQKTLLWPEELLNPSWRDNKTKIFRDFEAAIRQTDVTPANAARAYGTYLDDFRIVASLEICGTFLQTVFDGHEAGLFTSVLHVVGRTRGGVPRRYFYRRLNRHEYYEEWTDWTPIDVDIQGTERDRPGGRKQNSDGALYEIGVHVLPVVWRSQLHLFWPTLVRKVDEPEEPGPIDSKNPTINSRFSQPYWEVKLCWTRREGEVWTPKEQSSALVETWWATAKTMPVSVRKNSKDKAFLGKLVRYPEPQFPDPNRLVLKAHVIDPHLPDRQSLQIVLAERDGNAAPAARFVFSFARAASEMEASATSGTQGGDHVAFAKSASLVGSYMGLKGSGALKAVASIRKPDGDLLFTPPPGFRLTTLNQAYGKPLEAPFFIGLTDRAYFASVTPGTTTAREEIANPAPVPNGSQLSAGAALKQQGLSVLGSVFRKAAVDPNPWLRADALQVSAATASLFQSTATADSATASDFIDSVKLNATLVDRITKAYRTIDVETIDVTITPFFHPFADQFATTLKRDGLDALLTTEMQRLALPAAATFAGACKPNPERVKSPAVEGIDFTAGSPNGNVNWEIFCFAPATVIQKLWDHNHFDAAIDLFQKALFDPLSAGADTQDAWRFEGLREVGALRLDQLMAALSKSDDNPEKLQLLAQIEAMRLYPFQAHRIARLRPIAYKKWALALCARLYLARGDMRFRRFTPEDVNLCLQDYIIARAIMGPRPEVMPQRVTMPGMSYAELRPNLDELGNVMFEAETRLAPVGKGLTVGGSDTTATGMLQRGAVGYFGIPKNEKLLGLWDEVEDRLFKVRNGMNIDGLQIQLPLFPPPIDPALLAQAVAAGLSISEVLDALSAPKPHHRYRVTHRQAVELAETVVRIGAALSDSREKRDNEDLARIRAAHEKEMAELIRQEREQQVTEAEANLEAVRAEREGPVNRWTHYRDLLGAYDVKAPGPDPDDPTKINTGRVKSKRPLHLVDAGAIEFEALSVIPEIAKGLALTASPSGGMAAALLDETVGGVKLAGGNILVEEKQELQESFEAVRTTFEAAMFDMLASMLNLIPNFEAAVKPFGAGAAVHMGGQALSAALSAKARNKHAAGAMHTFLSTVYGKQAGFVLRERDWVAQMNGAAAEVLSIDRKLSVANLQVTGAKHRQSMADRSLVHAEEIEAHLREKFTSLELQDFRIASQRQLFNRFLDVTLERARMAEACYVAEREARREPFIRVTRSDDPRLELTTGYELLACLADMDRNWMMTDARGPELVRHVSLRQVNPWALHDLRETGETTFSLPEVLFDMDHPGHYDRKIRSVQVTVPCVIGPYAAVNGTLTMTRSRRRPKANLTVEPLEDVNSGQPSISLSSGRDDAGVFELSLQDDRYLPFEGFGLISDWKLRLPQQVRQFNYREIPDVLLTIRYTAEHGGEKFEEQVSGTIVQALNELKIKPDSIGPFQMLSLRHDFPDAWHRFRVGDDLSVSLTADILPYVLRSGLKPTLEEVHVIPLPKGKKAEPAMPGPLVQDGEAWSLTIRTATDQQALDDITLLARFSLEQRQ